MSVMKDCITVMIMLPVMTQRVAMNVCATVATLEMGSIVQVSILTSKKHKQVVERYILLSIYRY